MSVTILGSLPNAIVGNIYSSLIIINGGIGPYTLSSISLTIN